MGIFGTPNKAKRLAADYRNLIRKESKIGGTLFGAIPHGVRREFFCLDETTWVWHEEWDDASKKHHVQTIRYTVRPDGIVKKLNNGHYTRVSHREAQHLLHAARTYRSRVHNELYNATA